MYESEHRNGNGTIKMEYVLWMVSFFEVLASNHYFFPFPVGDLMGNKQMAIKAENHLNRIEVHALNGNSNE